MLPALEIKRNNNNNHNKLRIINNNNYYSTYIIEREATKAEDTLSILPQILSQMLQALGLSNQVVQTVGATPRDWTAPLRRGG